MKFLNKIADLDRSQTVGILKESIGSSEFAAEMEKSKWEIIEVLLQRKIFLPELGQFFEKSDLVQLGDLHVQTGFTPTNDLIEKLLSCGNLNAQYTVDDIFNTFSSIPVTNELVLMTINFGYVQLAHNLIKRMPKVDKGIFVALLNKIASSEESIEMSPEVEEMILNNTHKVDLLGLILKCLRTHLIEVSDLMCSEIVEHVKFNDSDVPKLVRDGMSAKLLRKLHAKSARTARQRRWGGYNRDGVITNVKMGSIEWSEEVEKLNQRSDKYLDIDVVNPPKESKFWPFYLGRHPEKVPVSDLMKYVSGDQVDSRILCQVVKEILKNRGLSYVKKINFKKLADRLPLRDILVDLKLDSEVALYLYKSVLDEKTGYKDWMLEFLDNSDREINFSKISKKLNDSELVREVLDSGYSIENFVEDFRSQNENRHYYKIRTNTKLLNMLTREEFLFFIEQDVVEIENYSNYYLDLNYELKASEITEAMFDKLRMKDILKNTGDKGVLIKRFPGHMCQDISCVLSVLEKCDEGMDTYKILYNVLKEQNCLESIPAAKIQLFRSFDAKFEANFLESLDGKTSFEQNDLDFMVKTYTSKELQDRLMILGMQLKDCSHIMSLKCKDDEFLIPDDLVIDFFIRKKLHENKNHIDDLFYRDLGLFQEVAKAYLKGLDHVARLAGVYPTRGERRRSGVTDIYKNHLVRAEKITPAHLEEARNILSMDCLVSKLVSKDLFNLYFLSKFDCDSLIEFDIKPENISDPELGKILSHTRKFKFKIDKFSVGSEDEAQQAHRVQFQELVVKYYGKDTIVNVIEMSLDGKNSSDIVLNYVDSYVYSLCLSTFIELDKKGIRFKNHQDIINHYIQEDNIDENLTGEELEYAAESGMVFNDKNVLRIISTYKLTLSAVEYLVKRLGSLERFTVKTTYYDDEVREALEDAGVTILNGEDYELYEIKQGLLVQGEDFESIDVSKMSTNLKIELINFIETKVDARYKKLNMVSKNLSLIKVLSCYSALVDSVLTSDEDIVRVFSVPGNMQKNKKFLTAISSLLSVNPSLPMKVNLYKKVVAGLIESCSLAIDPVTGIGIDDYIDRSGFGQDHSTVIEREEFERIPFWALQCLNNSMGKIQEAKFFMRGQNKKSLSRFFRSLEGRDFGYVNDIFDMMKAVEKGMIKLEERRQTLIKEDPSDPIIADISKLIDSINGDFAAVSKMDDATLMHDRVSAISSTLNSDPFQKLEQDYLSPLEESREVPKVTGVKLLFPKNRGDLIELGNIHGWCVNGTSRYGDEVITKGNILVALVPKSNESTLENVVALAHFIKDDTGGYYLEQLRWSKLKKKGHGNVDATSDFNHKAILSMIENHVGSIPTLEKGMAA